MERCASGEIGSVRELEAEISRLKDSMPVPLPKSKGKRATTTDVEAQVQQDQKAKLPIDSGGYGRNTQQQPIDLARIRKCASEKIRQALDQDKSRWFQSPDDCRLCAEVTLDPWVKRITELVIFHQLTPAQARAQAEEEYALDPDQISRSLRIKLRGFLSDALDKGSWSKDKGETWVNNVKHPIWNMVSDCQLKDLFALIDFDPKSLQEFDETSLQEAAHEVITRVGDGARSIVEVLAARSQQAKHATSQDSAEGESDRDKENAPALSQPLRSEQELQALKRILRLCGGDNPQEIAIWRRALAGVKSDDLLAWEQHNDEEVRKIGRLMHGDMGKGLREAIRVVERRVDMRTPVSMLIDLCLANGGRWEHIDGPFRIVVDKGSAFDREGAKERLCNIVEGTPEREPIKEALERNKWKLSDGELAALDSLRKPLLQKILVCLLYDSGLNDTDIAFKGSAI
jgi:hypothetical protein